jgi:hypothetical protein
MMPVTYDPISTQTVSGSSRLYLRFNGITSNTYSDTYFTTVGDAYAGRDSTQNAMTVGGAWNGISTSLTATSIISVMNYTNTTTFKTLLSKLANDKGNGTGSSDGLAGIWQSTSAITSVSLIGGAVFLSGSTFSLYGIKAA